MMDVHFPIDIAMLINFLVLVNCFAVHRLYIEIVDNPNQPTSIYLPWVPPIYREFYSPTDFHTNLESSKTIPLNLSIKINAITDLIFLLVLSESL